MFNLDREILKNFALFGNFGLTIIINILTAIGLYKVLEKWLGLKSDILFIIFLILGIISGFYSIYKMIMKK